MKIILRVPKRDTDPDLKAMSREELECEVMRWRNYTRAWAGEHDNARCWLIDRVFIRWVMRLVPELKRHAPKGVITISPETMRRNCDRYIARQEFGPDGRLVITFPR